MLCPLHSVIFHATHGPHSDGVLCMRGTRCVRNRGGSYRARAFRQAPEPAAHTLGRCVTGPQAAGVRGGEGGAGVVERGWRRGRSEAGGCAGSVTAMELIEQEPMRSIVRLRPLYASASMGCRAPACEKISSERPTGDRPGRATSASEYLYLQGWRP